VTCEGVSVPAPAFHFVPGKIQRFVLDRTRGHNRAIWNL
jgi:hypothetical protein